MPKFTIYEKVIAYIEIEADTAEDALHIHMEGLAGHMDEIVEGRWVEDEAGKTVEVTEPEV